MKKFFLITLVVGLATTSAFAGKIHGSVRAQGRKEVEQAAEAKIGGSGGGYDDKKLKFAEIAKYDSRRDFIVFIEGVTVTNPPTDLPPTANVEARHAVDQRGATFSPHLMGVMCGTTVKWLNNDKVYHNVFSMSDAASFDLGLCKPTSDMNSLEVARYTFDKPGRVDVFCSIHANMNCVVYVMDNPWFASTDGRGNYLIANIPPGTYKLRAWGERVPSQVKEITVTADSEETVDFVLGWPGDQNSALTTNVLPATNVMNSVKAP